jgi:hypothetical protein
VGVAVLDPDTAAARASKFGAAATAAVRSFISVSSAGVSVRFVSLIYTSYHERRRCKGKI